MRLYCNVCHNFMKKRGKTSVYWKRGEYKGKRCAVVVKESFYSCHKHPAAQPMTQEEIDKAEAEA